MRPWIFHESLIHDFNKNRPKVWADNHRRRSSDGCFNIFCREASPWTFLQEDKKPQSLHRVRYQAYCLCTQVLLFSWWKVNFTDTACFKKKSILKDSVVFLTPKKVNVRKAHSSVAVISLYKGRTSVQMVFKALGLQTLVGFQSCSRHTHWALPLAVAVCDHLLSSNTFFFFDKSCCTCQGCFCIPKA